MHITDLLTKGKDIKIIRRDGRKYTVTVNDIFATVISVSEIVQEGATVNFDKDEHVNLIVNKDNDTYNLGAKVQGYQTDANNKRFLKLGAYTSTVPNQKRDVFRLKIDGMTADIKAFCIYDVGKLQYEGQAEIVDLSETGMGLRVKQQLNHNGFVNCKFMLDGEKLGFTGRIVYCLQARGRYAVGINFLDGSEAQRRSIRKYILCKQVRRED